MVDVLLIVAVVLLLFGAKKLRTVGSDLGAAVKGFKKALAGADERRQPLSSERPDAEFPEAASAGERKQH